MANEAPKEGLDISALQMDLLTIALGEPDPSIGEKVFPIVHKMKGDSDVLEVLSQLKDILPPEKLNPIIERVETALVGKEFMASPLKKSLALKVVRSPAKAKALEWLRNIDESEITTSISVIVAAIEVEIGEVFEDAQIEGLALRPRSARYRDLARSLVELHAKHHAVSTRNFMVILNGLEIEAATSEISFGLLQRIRTALGEAVEKTHAEPVAGRTAGEQDEGGATAGGQGGSTDHGPGKGGKGGTAAGARPAEDGDDEGAEPPEDEGDGKGSDGAPAEPKSFVAFVMTSSTDKAKAYYERSPDPKKQEMQEEILRQIEIAKQNNNALLFIYFYTLAKAIGISDSAKVTEAELRAIYANLIVKKVDPRPLGRFLNCVLSECSEITGIKDRSSLEAKWKLREDEYPKSLNEADQTRLIAATGYLGGVKSSSGSFNFAEALRRCESPENLLLATIMHFIVDPEHNTQILNEVLKGIRTSDLGDKNPCDLINAAFDKAVEIFVHTDKITSVGILALRKLCETRGDGIEGFERLGRSFVKYLNGRFKHADKVHIDVLERTERLSGNKFVSVNAFYKPDKMAKAVEGLIYDAVSSLQEVTGLSAQAVLRQKRAVAAPYAKLIADFRECLGYKGRVRHDFFSICRQELAEYGSSEDVGEKNASVVFAEVLGVTMFPDFVCEPSNRQLFRLIGIQGNESELRNLLERIKSEEAKLSFIAIVKGNPTKAFNYIVDVAASASNTGDIDIMRDVIALLIKERILDIPNLKSAILRSSIHRADSDWGALQPNEQQPVLQMIEALGLN